MELTVKEECRIYHLVTGHLESNSFYCLRHYECQNY
jgi:hypothetical protein